MIISHQHQFIFIHCRKTAGSSITAYLNRFLGPNDIQIGAWHNAVEAGGRLNRRFVIDVADAIARNPGVIRGLASSCISGAISRRYLIKKLNMLQKTRYEFSNAGHPRADELKTFASSAWREYFKLMLRSRASVVVT